MKHTSARDLNRPYTITRILLGGSAIVVLLFTLLLCGSYIIGNHYVAPRIGIGVVAFVYLFVARRFLNGGFYRTAAWLILAMFTFLAVVVSFEWSLNTPVGLVMYCSIIILAGAMLGSRSIIPVTIGIIVLLCLIQAATYAGIAHTDYSSFARASTTADVGGYAVLFIVFALVAWLSGRRMELSLDRALDAEADLAAERDSLEVRLEEKTQEVREAQMKEMSQLYRLAEFGQLGTVLLHDLANNLTILTMDIDDIKQQNRHSQSIDRAKESIAYIDTMVAGVRRQLDENDDAVVFDARRLITETIDGLAMKAKRAGVVLTYEPADSRQYVVHGDSLRFTHILTILISNAIDAYDTTNSQSYSPAVVIATRRRSSQLELRFTDYGKGISLAQRANLFQPFETTKPTGMGIGLFMAREMAERHFKGTLRLDPSREATIFVLAVPLSRKKLR